MEFFVAAYSGNEYEGFTFLNRMGGPYWWAYWTMISCNVLTPQLFWFRKIRTSVVMSFILSIFVNIGMWFERFVIVVTSLHRDSLVSSWDYFVPVTEVFFLLGTFACSSRCLCCSSALPGHRDVRSEGRLAERQSALGRLGRDAARAGRCARRAEPVAAIPGVPGAGVH